MAKAKKSEMNKPEKKGQAKSEKPAAASAAKKAPAAKKAAPSKPAPATGEPMIDTSLAAANAARLLAGGFNKPAAAGSSGSKSESAMFKNLKAGLNKPSSAAMSNLLDKAHGPEPTKSHTGFSKQVGHNQTYGADVNRSGVPRRTPG